jgi:hypothetical protein
MDFSVYGEFHRRASKQQQGLVNAVYGERNRQQGVAIGRFPDIVEESILQNYNSCQDVLI